jgi:hypothetical protein
MIACGCPKTSARMGAYQWRPRRSLLGLGGLGAVDLSQYNLAQQLLQQARNNITQLQSAYAQNPDAFSSDTLASINEAQSRYTDILKAYIYAYTGATGQQVPVSLYGLGQWQTYVVAGVAIGVIIAALYELNNYIAATQTKAQADLNKSQTAMNAQAQAAQLQNQAAAAYASGDTVTGDRLTALAAQSSQVAAGAVAPSQSLTDFVTANAGWIAAGVAAVILLPKLMD